MRLYSNSRMTDLTCSQGHSHNIRENCLDVDDVHAEEILIEFSGVLFKETIVDEPTIRSRHSARVNRGDT